MTSIQRTIKFEKKPQKGEKGASPRGPQAWSDMPDNYMFYQGKDGEEYKDVVLYNGTYYTCIKTHQKNSSNYPLSSLDTSNHYWQKADQFELVATNLFLANYALIKNLGVEAIEMKDPKDNSKILFQVKDGNVTCKTGTFENITIGSGCVNYGVNRQPFVSGDGAYFEGDDVWLETELHDNLAFNDLKDGWQTFASLPFDQKANGRRILIVRSVWNNISPYDITQVSAPDGKYFFEDGLRNKYLKVKSNEALLLAGYGDDTDFMGWIVLLRIPMWTVHPHGSVHRVIYEGKCYGNGTKLKYKAYNGAKLTCSRFDNGSYKISFETPFKSTDEYEVMLTACGMNGNTAHAVFASLDKKNTSYFTVRCADDPSLNDASFLFQVIPTWDWITNS